MTLITNIPYNKSVSFIIVIIFWASIYITGISEAIYGYKGWAIILLVWFISFSSSSSKFYNSALSIITINRKEFLMLAIWIFVILLNLLFDRGDNITARQHLNQTIIQLIVYCLATLYLYNSPVRYEFTCISVIIALGIVSIINLPPLYSNPGLLREIKYDPAQLSNMGLRWVGTTNYFSGYSIVLPCLYVVILKQNIKYKIIFGFLCLLSILSILMSTMASAIFLLSFGLIGLFLFSQKYKKNISIRLLLLTIFCILCISVLMYSYKVEQFSYFLIKSSNIYYTIINKGLSEVERGSDAVLSLNVIQEFPLFGIGPVTVGTFTVIGEHSSWLDSIAQYGLLGFAPFIGFLYFGFCRLWRSHILDRNNMINQARIISFILYILQGLINPWAFDSTAMTLFLILAMAPEISQTKCI